MCGWLGSVGAGPEDPKGKRLLSPPPPRLVPTLTIGTCSPASPASVVSGIFLLGGQRLLPAYRLCSVVSSASENVFLVHPWREMCSTSTYSSTVLYLVSGCVFTFSFNLILLCIIKKSFKFLVC